MSLFIYKYNSIRDMAKVNMDHYCNGVYCEAETDRFQLAKHIYDLVLPNDVYNAKTYTILVLIYSIILFIVAYFQFTDFLIKDANKWHSTILRVLIPILILILLILNLVYRYEVYKYNGYFKDVNITKNHQADFNDITSMSIAFVATLFFALNIFVLNNKIKGLFYTAYLAFMLYFMFNMINIVETFKTNTVPFKILRGDKSKEESQEYKDNWSADISYASENVFYYNFFNLKEIPDYLKINFLWGPQYYDDAFDLSNDYTYDYYLFYYFRNLMQFVFVFFFIVLVIFIVLFISYIFNYESFRDYVLPLTTPLIALTTLVFFIVGFTTFNTGFNKYVLYGVHGSCYKQALNQMNNVLVPYIAMHENYTGTGISTQRNYLYHYIVLNVLVSYLKNYITLTNIGAQNIDIAGYKSTEDMKTLKIKFNKIEANDISDLQKFEEYYKGLMRKVLKYELDNIPTNLKIEDINSTYIDGILKKIFTSTTPFFSYQSTSVSTYKTNIKDAVYYYIYLLNMKNFNTKIEQYNKDPTSLTDILHFYIEKDLTSHPYKFLLKPPTPTTSGVTPEKDNVNKFKKGDKPYYDTSNTDNVLKVLDATMVDSIIELFLEHINSLFSDVKNATNGYEVSTKSENDKLSIFRGNIYTSLTMLSSTKGNKEDNDITFLGVTTKREGVFYDNKDLVLKYLYHEMVKTMKVSLETNNNYLTNAIENMYYQLNKENATVKLYDVDVVADKKSLQFDKNTDNANLQSAKYLKAWNKEHDNQKMDPVNNILHNANSYASVNFFFAYAVNIVILFIMYYAIVQKNK